jgi:hypothetical protein
MRGGLGIEGEGEKQIPPLRNDRQKDKRKGNYKGHGKSQYGDPSLRSG